MNNFEIQKIKERICFLFESARWMIAGEQAEQLSKLVDLLQRYNKVHNLTAITDVQEILTLHIMDSASSIPFLLDSKNIADFGTGAGFPGFVIAVLKPDCMVSLIESSGKKVAFLRTASQLMGLNNIRILHSRAEKLPSNQNFDCVISRAVASLADLCTLCVPLLAENGKIFAMKSRVSDEELQAVPQSVKIVEIRSVTVPGLPALRQIVTMMPAVPSAA